MLLRNVSWETYERPIDEREECSVPRFFYDRGELRIMSPCFEQEAVSRIVASLVGELAVELGIDVSEAGSTTFKREDLERGFEPDECFYFSDNAEQVRGGQNLDLDAGDPPPDPVVEVDLTNPSLNTPPIYAHLGIAEVWRLSGGKPEVLVPDSSGAGYEASERSRVLPFLTNDALSRLVEEGLKTRRPDWRRRVREWAGRETDRSLEGG